MYIIINKTKQTRYLHEDSFPSAVLDEMLDNGDRVIVISLYTNLFKVPFMEELNGVRQWCWENFPLDRETLLNYGINYKNL
jgi:hypothetical protein